MSQEQPNNPLHGLTLKAILEELLARHGWEELGERINIRCFQSDPSIGSSLKFLRKTPWARTKVERLYLEGQRPLGDTPRTERRSGDADPQDPQGTGGGS